MTRFDEGVGRAFRLSVFDESRDMVAQIARKVSWESVREGIVRVHEHGGYVKLRVSVPEDSMIERVTMTSQQGRFRLTVARKSEDLAGAIYEWWDLADSEFRGFVLLGDDRWDSRTFCSDVSVALDVFSELYETGELAKSMKHMRSYWVAG